MSALNLYTLCMCLIEGGLLTEEIEVRLNRDSKAIPMSTVAKQFAGMSPGAGLMMMDFKNGVPSSDFELNPGKFFVKQLKVVEVTLFAGGRTLATKGFIPSDAFQHGVNAAAILDFQVVAQMADWE